MLFRAEDTSRANYRSLFEYAVGDEARLAQDRRLAYYERVLPEMLARVKGLPLMYQTYSKRWSPEDNRPQFIVKRLVPNEDGDKIDIVMESDQDIADFMARKGRFKGQHGFNKGFSYLAPIYHVERDEMPFIQVDLDIDQADFGKQAWSRLLEAVEQVYNWFRENGYDALINFTGSSFHVWAKDGQVRTYAETKQVLEALSEATGLPLAAGAAHVAGQITIDYPQNKYRAPLRFPLSIHGDTGLVSIIIPRNQLRRFDPLKRAHPEEVLKRLPKELERIDAWFSDLSTTTTKQAEETFSAESRKMKELKNRIRIQLAKLDEPLPDSTNHGTPRRLFYEAVRDSYGKGFPRGYLPSMAQIGRATRQVEREMSAESQSSAADIIQRRLDELSDADKERCIWGDCGILADQLMKALQQAGHTDAVYEIGLAYIHPFEDYESKDFIGGHVVVTVDGESYDAYGAGAKERWVEGPVIQDILAESGFVELGPLLSAHLTVNWITSTWDEIRESRSNLFSGQDVSAALDNWTLGKGAETEYKKKRQKPTPEPGVEGGTDLKPSRLKPPMKVKGSNVYSVQKHRAEKRGSHRDIRIGLDGTLLSFVPVGRGFGKSRLPKKIGEGVSVIRTEDHPFDYWWFEGEIPKDSYGAGPVSLETYGTRRIIEWKPDEKLKVEFIGGKYAGTYTFERSKKSKDGKVWWMRKSRPVPENEKDTKTKRTEEIERFVDEKGRTWELRRPGGWVWVESEQARETFVNAFEEWSEKFLAGELPLVAGGWGLYHNRNQAEPTFNLDFERMISDARDLDYVPHLRVGDSELSTYVQNAIQYVENLLMKSQYAQGKLKLYRGIDLVNPEDFDPINVGQSWTPVRAAAQSYFGHKKIRSRNLGFIYDNVDESKFKSYVLTALVPVDSIDWYTTVLRALAFSHLEDFDEKEIVLKRGAPIELVDVPFDLSFAIDGTPEALIRAAEEDDGGKSEFERKYIAKVREYEQSEEWYDAVLEMSQFGDESFDYALEGRLESLFPDLELPLSQQDYEELKLANPELVDEERAVARGISDDMLDRVYAMLFARQGTYWNYMVSWSKEHEAEYRDGKILLYREITMNNPAELDTARAGIFWTPVLQSAEAHWGGTGERFLLRALVDFEDINWKSSWYANLIHPEECEIRLRQGAKIELLPLTRPLSRYGRNRQVGEYVYPEEIVFEIEAPSPNLLAVEQGTETELLEAIKDLPEEYQRLIGIYPVEPQPTRTGFASEQDEVVLYHGTATANVESILQEGLRPDYGWAMDSFQKGVFLATHPSSAAPWARWSAMRALAPDSQIASEGETSKFYQLMARLRMEEADAVTILEVRIPKNSYQYLYCDYADLVDSGIELTYEREARSNEDYDWTFADDEELVKSWEECLRNGINLVYEGRIPPKWISVLPWQSDWKSNYWFERITDMISERGEDYFDAEQIFDYVSPQETVEWGFLQSYNRTAHPEGYVAQRYKNWSAPITGELLDSFLENSLYHGTTEKAWELTQRKGYFTPREPFESQAKTGQSSLEGKNLIRQIGTYVTPVAGHAWQYAVGDWGPGSSKDRPSGGAPLVLKINPDLVSDLPWFIDLRDRAPSFFTTGRIPVEAVERVIEIPAEWPQRGLTSEPFSWYEHPMMPLINEDFGDPNPSYLKENSKDLKTWRFWQEAIFEPGFLDQQSFEEKQRRVEEFTGRPYETVEPCSCPDDKTYASSDEVGKVWVTHPRTYGRTVPEGEHIVRLQTSYPGYDQEQNFQKEWWEDFNRQLEEFYVTQMGLTPAEFRLLRQMAEEDESVAAFIRSENMGEPYKFNLWTRWWPKPRTSAETTRPYKDYSLEDLLDVTGDWKNTRQELGIRMANLLQERQWASEDIDLTVGEAFDTALAEIRADVEAIQPRSKDLSEVTLEDYEKTKQVYQRFMIPAGITGSIVRDEWHYDTEPIYNYSDLFILRGFGEEEWKAKIDAGRTETERDILASNEINYAFYWFAVMQINSIYNKLLSRLGEREMYTGVYAGPPVELPDIIESQRDETEVEIYRWLATSKDEQPVRRLRNRMRPVDLNYYGGYGDVDRVSTGTAGGTVVSVRKGLEALSYGPCWSLSPDAYTRTDQWRLAQEDVVLKERKVRLSPFEKAWRMPTEEEIDVRTYVIEKSIPASALDWYSTLISCALWSDSPEYEVIPKRGVFLSEEVEA